MTSLTPEAEGLFPSLAAPDRAAIDRDKKGFLRLCKRGALIWRIADRARAP
jgi:hypothetical protein